MPILNLTPHAISLYHAPDLVDPLAFERAGGGFLIVGGTSPEGGFRMHGYSRWFPQSISARVSEERSDVVALQVPSLEDYQGPGELPGGGIWATRDIPVRTVRHGAITGLPDPADDTYLIVSLPVVAAAREAGRVTSDLLTPGDLVRSPQGEIAGVTSFYRW